MDIKFSISGQAHPLILEGEIIEKVNTLKLLGIYFQDYNGNQGLRLRRLAKRQSFTKPSY